MTLPPLFISENSPVLISQFAYIALNPTAPQKNKEIEYLRVSGQKCYARGKQHISL